MLIIPKLITKNRQKSYAHLWKREAIWAWYRLLCSMKDRDVLEMGYEIDIIKPNGKISDKIIGRAESYTRLFYNFLGQNMLGIEPSTYSMGAYGVGSLSMKDTDGTGVTTQTGHANLDIESLANDRGVRCPVNQSYYGIIFDRSDTAYTFEQTAGVTPVTTGTGANQLTYGDTFLPYMTYDAGDNKWTCIWERMALNNTVGQTSVDVKSLCLYFRDTGAKNYMVARDVLVSTITVPYGSQIKGRWTLTHDR